MIRLTRAGWNNVIIFAVMGFILLINATHDNVFYPRQSSDPEYIIIENSDEIIALTINPNIKVERIGQTWRSSSSNMSQQALSQMMSAWKNSAGLAIDQPLNIDKQLALIVNIELVGQAEILMFSLHVKDQQLLLYNHQTDQWLAFPVLIYDQLIPEQLFSS